MNVELQSLLAVGGVFGSIAASWGIVKYRQDRHERDDDRREAEHLKLHDTLFALIREVKVAQADHEKESSQVRLDYEKRFGKHDTNIEVNQSQYAEIIRQIAGLREEIRELKEANGQ